ncbi:hypothetical protein DPMN_184186 [Dreissena polymorpha]|uniref:Uncharacterized protein n=1 Tax=Dreissena polymorpha TaxID=45954 RepID=A0A9D4I656_DREPO|nr:hypothetical protein DPMN_184186 [Dreissena polymorpha]
MKAIPYNQPPRRDLEGTSIAGTNVLLYVRARNDNYALRLFLKGVSELGKIKDESTTSNGLNAVPKTKGKRSPNDSGSDEKLMASVDLKSRQRSPRKTESPVKQLLKQPLGTDEFSVIFKGGVVFVEVVEVVIEEAVFYVSQIHLKTFTSSFLSTDANNDWSRLYVTKRRLDVECYGICYHDNAFYITSGWSTDKEVQIMGR